MYYAEVEKTHVAVSGFLIFPVNSIPHAPKRPKTSDKLFSEAQQRVFAKNQQDDAMSNNDWVKEPKVAANDSEANMTWTRGLRRQAMIADKLEADGGKSKVTLPPMPAFMSSDLSV